MGLRDLGRAALIEFVDYGGWGVEDPQIPPIADLTLNGGKDQPVGFIGMPAVLLEVLGNESLIEGNKEGAMAFKPSVNVPLASSSPWVLRSDRRW